MSQSGPLMGSFEVSRSGLLLVGFDQYSGAGASCSESSLGALGLGCRSLRSVRIQIKLHRIRATCCSAYKVSTCMHIDLKLPNQFGLAEVPCSATHQLTLNWSLFR